MKKYSKKALPTTLKGRARESKVFVTEKMHQDFLHRITRTDFFKCISILIIIRKEYYVFFSEFPAKIKHIAWLSYAEKFYESFLLHQHCTLVLSLCRGVGKVFIKYFFVSVGIS